MIEWLQTFLSENQFASGGLMLVLLTSALYTVRRIPNSLIALGKRRLILQVEILDTDPAFSWFALWLALQHQTERSRRLSIVTSVSDTEFQLGLVNYGSDGQPQVARSSTGRVQNGSPDIYFVPAPGLHIVRFEGRWLFVTRSRESGGAAPDPSGSSGWRTRQEQFTIRTRFGNRELIRQLIEQARDLMLPPHANTIAVHVADYGTWSVGHHLPPRPMSSVILAHGVADTILNDVRRFQRNRDWYHARHLPYRRGYLFHGPPGNGKTTTALALATELGMSVGYISLLANGVTDNNLANLLRLAARDNMLVVIEDLDCAFEQRERKGDSDGESGNVSFSGLLNTLDGLMSPEGQIVVMTTNRKDLLDDALLRPGRVDLDVYLGYANTDQAARMIRRFFPDGAKQDATEGFLELVDDQSVSMAHVQQELIRGSAPRLTVEDLQPEREKEDERAEETAAVAD